MRTALSTVSKALSHIELFLNHSGWHLAQLRSGWLVLASSELTLLEVLVRPLKSGNVLLEMNFRSILQKASDVQLIPITTAILERAAHLRAASNLKTPDAIHAATALEHGCALFVTHDSDFRRVSGLPETVLADLLTP